jgi:hypothetical protein
MARELEDDPRFLRALMDVLRGFTAQMKVFTEMTRIGGGAAEHERLRELRLEGEREIARRIQKLRRVERAFDQRESRESGVWSTLPREGRRGG